MANTRVERDGVHTGQEVDTTEEIARYLVAIKKAVYMDAADEAAPGPLTTESAGVIAGKDPDPTVAAEGDVHADPPAAKSRRRARKKKGG